MIYLPGRAVFIHVPRAAGNSITNAIASACAGNNFDIFIGTGAHSIPHWWHFARHTRACVLKKYITEWDDIFKFAIYRPEEERLNSIKALVDKDIALGVHKSPLCADGWKKVLSSEDKEWYWDIQRKQDLAWFTKGYDGEDLGVEIFDYYKLNEQWWEICVKCDIPQCSLPHLNKA